MISLSAPWKWPHIDVSLASATFNNLTIANFDDGVIIRLFGAGNFVLSGLAGGDSGRMIFLINMNGVTMQLLHQNAGSLATNRFQLNNLSNVTYTGPGNVCGLVWSGANSWTQFI